MLTGGDRWQEGDAVATLAAEYVQRRVAGEVADLDGYLQQIPDAAGRTRFQNLVAGADRIDRLLPRPMTVGRILARRYRLEEKLGCGGMGMVFAAFDLRLKRQVAVKVLGALDSAGIDAGRLFKRESELLASLQHPGIVSMHEAGEDDGVRYIVMDRVAGRSLDKVLECLRGGAQGECPPPGRGRALLDALELCPPPGGRTLVQDESWSRTVARFMVELVRILEAAHGQGVVHRDLKPANVMVLGDAMPVVLDFGLGGHLHRPKGDLTRRLFGSAAYLAPEQAARGETGADVRSDIYQLGLLLYECLTLQRAFPGDDLSEVLQSIGSGEFVRPRALNAGIPRDLEAICLMAMELDPERRYQSARDLRADLELFLDGSAKPRAVRGGPLAALGRDGRYLLRRHKVSAALVGALLLGLSGGIWFFAGDRFHAVQMELVTWDPVHGDLRSHPTMVEQGDYLGVQVKVEEPRWVYAYAFFGDGDHPYAEIAPVWPVDGLPGNEPRALENRIAPGTHRIIYSRASRAREGLVVFVLKKAQPALKEWLRLVRSEAEAGLSSGITLSRAIDDLRARENGTRGGTPRRGFGVDEMRRERLRLERAPDRGRRPLPFDELEHKVFILPLGH